MFLPGQNIKTKIHSYEPTALTSRSCLLRHLRRQSKKNFILNPKQIETISFTNDPYIYMSLPSITFVNVSLLLSLVNRKRYSLRRLAAIENAKNHIQQFDDDPLTNSTQMINRTLNRFEPSMYIDYCVLN
jgi:hypothetical protein